MNMTLITERVSPYYGKLSSIKIPATAIHAFLSVLLLAFAVQGVPFLAVHAANVISSVQLGYWLSGGGAVMFFATILWVLFSKN